MCTHRSCFCKHGVEESNISLVTHGHPIFPRHGEDHMRTSVTKFSNQKIWNAKNLQRATETVLRKECREILTNTFDSGATSG